MGQVSLIKNTACMYVLLTAGVLVGTVIAVLVAVAEESALDTVAVAAREVVLLVSLLY